MIYTHVLNHGYRAVRSPADFSDARCCKTSSRRPIGLVMRFVGRDSGAADCTGRGAVFVRVTSRGKLQLVVDSGAEVEVHGDGKTGRRDLLSTMRHVELGRDTPPDQPHRGESPAPGAVSATMPSNLLRERESRRRLHEDRQSFEGQPLEASAAQMRPRQGKPDLSEGFASVVSTTVLVSDSLGSVAIEYSDRSVWIGSWAAVRSAPFTTKRRDGQQTTGVRRREVCATMDKSAVLSDALARIPSAQRDLRRPNNRREDSNGPFHASTGCSHPRLETIGEQPTENRGGQLARCLADDGGNTIRSCRGCGARTALARRTRNDCASKTSQTACSRRIMGAGRMPRHRHAPRQARTFATAGSVGGWDSEPWMRSPSLQGPSSGRSNRSARLPWRAVALDRGTRTDSSSRRGPQC